MARTINLPTFDFLTGTEIPPVAQSRQPLRESLRQSESLTRQDIQNEALRTQLKRLQYELDAVKQERELTIIQHQEEIRAVQERAESDYKRAQTAQSDGSTAARQLERLRRDLDDAQTQAANERTALERKLRDIQADSRALREELEYERTEALDNARKLKYDYDELKQRYDATQGGVNEVQDDLDAKVALLREAQQKLLQKETENDEFQQEILRLKSQAGDTDTFELIKDRLTEHVEYSRTLEETNRQQLNELRQFRKNAKNVEVVEDEKRSLENKVKFMHDLRRELAEEQLQRRILEDEKRSWTSYFEDHAADQDMRYDTPEDMAKALLQERLQRLDLMGDIGNLRPELAVKDDNIRALSEELRATKLELDKMRSNSGAGDVKLRTRLEKQRNLALKEVEYLRAQINNFKAEEAEQDEAAAIRDDTQLGDLEKLLEQYRTELQTVHSQLLDIQQPTLHSPKKRAREDDEDGDTAQRIGEITRRAHTLQEELSQMQRQYRVLEAELKSSRLQVSSMQESRTRTLELRNNPTAEFQAIKLQTLKTLKAENADLIARLEGRPSKSKTVPISMLESSKLELDEVKAELARSEKKMMRLRQIFSDKSLEFREAVVSILGWKLDFMPNGRVKVTSILNPTSITDGEEEENSIVFDGEKGTMKVSGGPQSSFAKELQSQIDFWVEDRKEIPGFLAACTLEFYDKSTRAQRM